MKKSYYLATAALGLLITTAVVGLATKAADTNATTPPAPPCHNQEFKDAVLNNDYNAWKTAMETKATEMRVQADKLAASINQATFDKLVQAYQLVKDGKPDEARAIFEELGIAGWGPMGPPGKGNGFGKGMMRGLHLGNRLNNK